MINLFFFHNEQKIFVMYDPPHLLKSVRNNFKNYNVLFDNSKIAKWIHVINLFDIDSKNKYRVAPRLSKAHLETKKFSSMKVKLAAQVLSHSVAAGICLLSTLGQVSSDATFTADFIGQMDELFDSFNSTSLTHSKPMASALTHTSNHIDMWKSKIQFIKSWHFINSEGRYVRAACKNGWILTINAIIQLWEFLKNQGFQFLLTKRLNQDCLENVFSLIRSKGGFRANPDCCQFLSAFLTLIIFNLIKPINFSNCENDDNLLTDVFKSYSFTPSMFTTSEIPTNTLSVSIPAFKDVYNVNMMERNAQIYFSGYLAKKVLDIVENCSYCETLLTQSKHLEENAFLLFFKEYDNFSCLKYPSDNLNIAIENFTDVFYSCIESFLPEPNISNLLYCEMNKINTDWLKEHIEHKNIIKDYIIKLYIKIMIHYYIKNFNRILSSSNKNNAQRLQNILNK